jgi:hypothetical protein
MTVLIIPQEVGWALLGFMLLKCEEPTAFFCLCPSLVLRMLGSMEPTFTLSED